MELYCCECLCKGSGWRGMQSNEPLMMCDVWRTNAYENDNDDGGHDDAGNVMVRMMTVT
jgi:hypothetical protein